MLNAVNDFKIRRKLLYIVFADELQKFSLLTSMKAFCSYLAKFNHTLCSLVVYSNM